MPRSHSRRAVLFALLLVAGVPLAGAQTFRDDLSWARATPKVQAITGEAPGQGISRFAGQPVIGNNGAELGTVADLLADVYSGQVMFLVISSANTGVDERLAPVGALRVIQPGAPLQLAIDIPAWEAMQPVKAEEYDALRVTVSGAARHELESKFRQAGAAEWGVTETSAEGGSQLVRLAALRGKRLSTGSEDVGRIDDVAVDIDTMKAAAVIGPEAGFAATDQRFLVPLRQLNLAARDVDPIRTSITRSEFELALRRDNPAISDAHSGTSSAPLLPTPRATSSHDDAAALAAAITSAVQDALSSQPTPSTGSVAVVEENGKLVLRGSVDSESTRQRIEAAVRSAAKPTPVENQLRVEPE